MPSPARHPGPPYQAIAAEIRARITRGDLRPGDRVPSIRQIAQRWGVAVATATKVTAVLRAEGLVTTRQGSGAFVAADASRVPFRIDPEGLSSIGDVLEVMELRLALEIEAAALAADRITSERLAPIGRALRAIETAIGRGESAIYQDFAFHLAIAKATGNPRFAQLLEVARLANPSLDTTRVKRALEAATAVDAGAIAAKAGSPAEIPKLIDEARVRAIEQAT